MTTLSLLNNGNQLAYVHHKSTLPDALGILFCGGFKSSMQGQKALALEAFCTTHNLSYTRFDYSGHGVSSGNFTNGDIGAWLSDALCVFDTVTSSNNKTIVVGSSMGAWIATLLTQQRANKIAGLVTLAAAPDFTEKLLLPALSEQQCSTLAAGKNIHLASDYDDGSPYPISNNLIEQSRKHCVLDKKINLNLPVRLLHGTNDQDVPYEFSVQLMETIQSNDITLTLIKNADHRLSSAADSKSITNTLQSLIEARQQG